MRNFYLQLKRIVTSTEFGCCILFTIILLFLHKYLLTQTQKIDILLLAYL